MEPDIEATACARELLYVYVYVCVYVIASSPWIGHMEDLLRPHWTILL